jgi:hypothetical protein
MSAAALMILPGCNNPVGSSQCASCNTAQLNPQEPENLTAGTNYNKTWNNGKGYTKCDFSSLSTDTFKFTWDSDSEDFNFLYGKGWSSGETDRVVSYSGNFDPDKAITGDDRCNVYLTFYGWTNNCSAEYYVLESYGEYSPASEGSGYTKLEEYDSHGVTYTAYYKRQKGQPYDCGSGTADFDQLYSVRTPRVGFGDVSGTIYLQDHMDVWKKHGYNAESVSSKAQALIIEGYVSEYEGKIRSVSGTATITVHEPVGVVVDKVKPSAPTLSSWILRNGIYRRVGLRWTASTDNSGKISKYKIYHNGSLWKTVSGSTLTYTYYKFKDRKTHTFYVRAVDPSGNVSKNSNSRSHKK